MFVICCKYNPQFPYIIELVDGIRRYHPTEKIVVVDSNSSDKTYFNLLKKYDVIIEDISNENWMIGAYWYTYKKYPNEEFYYFMHDSMKVKSNLTYLKENDLTILMHFERFNVAHFNNWESLVNENTKYEYNKNGYGCFGPIFFCKNKVMKNMLDAGVDKLLPKNKFETQICEGAYGFYLENQGYDLTKCSLFGNVFEVEGPNGKSGPPPHKTDWQFPIEKFYASHVDNNRL